MTHFVAKLSAVAFVAYASIISESAVAGDVSISSNANGGTIVVTASGGQFAGAIDSLTYRGVQYINTADHGREMQSDLSVSNYGECYNPTEAGSKNDGSGPTSSSVLKSLSNAGNILNSQTQAAFWLAPGQVDFSGCTAVNKTVLSNYLISTNAYFYGAAIPNLMIVNTSFYIPENDSAVTVEALTAYVPPSFGYFLEYNRDTRTLTKLNPDPNGGTNTQIYSPVIIGDMNGANATGVVSPSIENNVNGANFLPHYRYFQFSASKGNSSKWSCYFGAGAVSAGTTLQYSCSTAVGTVDEVIQALTAYPITGHTPTQMVPIYRFFTDTSTQGRFYTLSYTEGASNTAGHAPAFEETDFHLYPQGGTGLNPLYRCYKAVTVDHFISLDPNCEGQAVEGILGYAYDSPGTGLLPIYRYFGGRQGGHLITLNPGEVNLNIYRLEGILGYTTG